jgi:sn-glycerol 3-phosphate transport system permease protein
MVERAPVLDLLTHLLLILALAALCLPVWLALVAASLPAEAAARAPLPWLPGDHLGASLAAAWERGGLGRALVNSTLMALAVAGGKIAVSVLSAFALVYFRLRLRWLAFWAIFLSLMLPVEVRIVPTYEVVANVLTPFVALAEWVGMGAALAGSGGGTAPLKVSLVDSYAGLILPLVASATATFLFRQVFLAVPEELTEAALIDGCGPLRFLRSVLLPLSQANLAALFVILFVWSWNQYLWPLLVVSDPALDTAVVAVTRLMPSMDAVPRWNETMAAALLAMAPPILVVLVLQRWLVKGLVEGER